MNTIGLDHAVREYVLLFVTRKANAIFTTVPAPECIVRIPRDMVRDATEGDERLFQAAYQLQSGTRLLATPLHVVLEGTWHECQPPQHFTSMPLPHLRDE